MSSRSGGRGLSTGKRVPDIIGDYLAADNPTNLATGDLNGDGIADLVVPNFHSNNISVLLGKADGSFQQVRLFDDGVGRPFDAVIADFNGNGKNDVAVTIPVTGVLIMLGDGAGNLTPTAILPAGAKRRIALSSSTNAVSFSSARTTNRFPSLRCASAIQIVRPLESMAETQPKLPTGFLEAVGDSFPVLHAANSALFVLHTGTTK